jgi:hypothetical protein
VALAFVPFKALELIVAVRMPTALAVKVTLPKLHVAFTARFAPAQPPIPTAKSVGFAPPRLIGAGFNFTGPSFAVSDSVPLQAEAVPTNPEQTRSAIVMAALPYAPVATLLTVMGMEG